MNWIPISKITPEMIGPMCDATLRLQLAQTLQIIADVCPAAVGMKRKGDEWVFEPSDLPATPKQKAKNLLTIWPNTESVRLEFFPERRKKFDEEPISTHRERLREVHNRILSNHGEGEANAQLAAASARDFRSPASYEAEAKTRDMIVPFLASRGFGNLKESRPLHGKVQSQRIEGTTPSRESIVLRVRLCWRKERSDKARGYSAAQIIPNVKQGRWRDALEHFVDLHLKEGITHLLLVQREDEDITFAALIPIREVPSVWQVQRDESARLIAAGMMGNRRRKNHAENGSSPTLWLEDEKAPSVPELLWKHPGVIDLAKLPMRPFQSETFSPEEVFDSEQFGEGALTEGLAKRRERSARLRELARIHFAKNSADGRLHCAICDWSPPMTLELTGPIVEIHHGIGISNYPTSGRDLTLEEALSHLAPLCPNCHRITHAKPGGGSFTPDDIRTALRRMPSDVTPTT